jgi:hypothetical protein
MEFIGIKGMKDKIEDLEKTSSEDQFCSFGLVPDFPRKLLSVTADQGQHPTNPFAAVCGEALVKSENKGTSERIKGIEQQIEGQEDIVIPRRVGDRGEDVEFASRYDDVCRSFYSDELNTLAKDKDGHSVDKCSATEHQKK